MINLLASCTVPVFRLLFPAVFNVRSSAEQRGVKSARSCKMPDLGGVDSPYCYNVHRSMYIGHDKRMAQDRSIGTLWVHIEQALVPSADYKFNVMRQAKRLLRGMWCEGRADNACDAYCKIHYEGEDEETKVAHDTLQPIWDEVFRFKVQRKTSRARVMLYDSDVTTRDDVLGHVRIPSVEELLGMSQLLGDGKVRWRGGVIPTDAVRSRVAWRGVVPIVAGDEPDYDPMSAPAERTAQMLEANTPVLYVSCGFIASKDEEVSTALDSTKPAACNYNVMSLQYIGRTYGSAATNWHPKSPQTHSHCEGVTAQPKPGTRSTQGGADAPHVVLQDAHTVQIQYSVRDYLMKFVAMFHAPCTLQKARSLPCPSDSSWVPVVAWVSSAPWLCIQWARDENT